MKTVLVFCYLILLSVEQEKVMRAISFQIGDMVLKCHEEMEFQEEVIGELLDFWNADNELKTTDLGCAFVCVFAKHVFFDDDFTLVQTANVEAFLKSVGADDRMSHRLRALFQMCWTSTKSLDNLCDTALVIAKCFRYGIFKMHWAPAVDYWKSPRIDSKTEHTVGEGGGDDDLLRELDPQLRREMYKRKMFTKLFRSCRK